MWSKAIIYNDKVRNGEPMSHFEYSCAVCTIDIWLTQLSDMDSVARLPDMKTTYVHSYQKIDPLSFPTVVITKSMRVISR